MASGTFRLCTAVVGGIASLALSACGFTALPTLFTLCKGFDSIGLTEVVGGPPALVFEDPGTIKVMHGSGSTKYFRGGVVKVEQSTELPPYVNQATVFLNGWNLAYTDSDHHVQMLGTMIGRIRVERGKLTWNAAGTLTDDDFEPPFAMKYHYTIVAWNDTSLRAMVDHNDIDHCEEKAADPADNFFYAGNSNMTTALTAFSSLLQNPGFGTGRIVAVVPRGTGIGFHSSSDHHLLQVAYNLESTESFVRHQGYRKGLESFVNPLATPSTGRAGGDFVSWNSYAILKDDARRRDTLFAEVVSGIGGADVGVVQPAYTILPINPVNGGTSGAGVKSAQVVIENLPYAYAVPMLTGWDIGYTVSDQHVKELGVWLDDLHYDRLPGASTGTLRYRVHSIVKDNDDDPDNFYTHKVTVLGLKALTAASIR